MSDSTAPSSKFRMKVNGEQQDIKMSYGLFQELLKIIPSVENLDNLMVNDPYLRDYVIRRVLTGNKHVSEDSDLVDPFELDVDLADIDDLAAWVMEHILHFFLKTATKTASVAEKYRGQLETLTQSSLSHLGSAD